jgi:hypothetical protein
MDALTRLHAARLNYLSEVYEANLRSLGPQHPMTVEALLKLAAGQQEMQA